MDDGLDPGIDDEDAAQALALADEHDKRGMEGIDVDRISQEVATAGQPPGVQPAGAVVPGAPPAPTTPATVPQVAPAQATPEAERAPTGEETAQAAQDVGAPPPRPRLTGDPTKDVQANLQWSRQLTDYQVALDRKAGEIAKRDAEVNSRRAEKEAEAERRIAAQREAEVAAYQQQRAQRQQGIDAAVAEKAAAYQDLKGGEKRSFGESIADAIAIALGSVGQGLMLAGHVAGAKNEGLEAINRRVETDHQRRLERLKAATDAALDARYGLKDAGENHRAALADIDADRAAKYRLIAAEAAQQLKAQGATDAEVKTNQVVVDSLKEAAKSEDAIHAREEAQQTQRAHYRVEEQQHLEDQQIRRQQLGLSYESARGAREDRAAAREDRENARKEKQALDAEGKVVYNPRTGDKIDSAPTTARAQVAQKKVEDIQDVRDDVAALKAHITNVGPVFPTLPGIGTVTDASAQRESLAKSLITRLSAFKGLGAISKDDREILERVTSGGWRQAMGMSGDQLDSITKALDKAEAAALRSQGIKAPPEKPAASKAPVESGRASAKDEHKELLDLAGKADMVTIKNAKTGETKRVTRAEAERLGAL